jgi:glycosyltransferase involved in cell wall biosynthesis
MQSRSVTVVIPCLNEEGNLERLFVAIDNAFQALEFTLPVLLIDDGSTDNSPQILTQLQERYPFLNVIRHATRQGVTGVWKTALAHVTTDWIYWGQADLESDFQTDLPSLLDACVAGVDGVAGWRQERGDGKVLASSLANWACRFTFKLQIHDMNWIKLVRRDLLVDLPIERITHRYLLAVLARTKHQIIEVPTPWHPRYSGQSKFGRGRLVSSAINFLQLVWWYEVDRRAELGLQQGSKLMKAIDVGFQVGKEAFFMQLKGEGIPSFSGHQTIGSSSVHDVS